MFFFGSEPQQSHHRFHGFSQVARDLFDDDLVGLDPREIKDVVDQLQ
jgi:hypothetical protein